MTGAGGSKHPHILVGRGSSKSVSGRRSSLKSWLPPIAAIVAILTGSIGAMRWIYNRWPKMEAIVAPLEKSCYRQGPMHIGGKYFPEHSALEYVCQNYGPGNSSRNYILKVLVPNKLDTETNMPQDLLIHDLGEVHKAFEGLEEETLCTISLKENVESLGERGSFGVSFFSVDRNWRAKDYYLLNPSHKRVDALDAPPVVQMENSKILVPIQVLFVVAVGASVVVALFYMRFYMRELAERRTRHLADAEAVRTALEEQQVAQAKMAMKDLLRRLEPPPPWRKKREE